MCQTYVKQSVYLFSKEYCFSELKVVFFTLILPNNSHIL